MSTWVALRRVAVICFLAVTVYSFAPWVRCTFGRMDAAQMDVLGEMDDSGAVRAERGEEFVGGVTGALGGCWASYPVGDNAPWQWPAIILSFLSIGLFGRLERARYAAQIKKHTSDYATVDAISRRPRRAREQDAITMGGPSGGPGYSPDFEARQRQGHSAGPQSIDEAAERQGNRSQQPERDSPDWEWD